jgi:hypothetical protein
MTPHECNGDFAVVNRIQDSTLKQQAFQLMEIKCNVCHLEKSASNVYMLENMELFAKDTFKQVSVNKRMPKGKEVVFLDLDKKILMDWLKTTDVKMD